MDKKKIVLAVWLQLLSYLLQEQLVYTVVSSKLRNTSSVALTIYSTRLKAWTAIAKRTAGN